ncbi:Protein TIFY 4B [Platanthera zijinensis]|uniref:Protein TIFY n=1 Tax=Platanthera zijinensis TaxID=2320716 RepID=A0AAP0BGB9_9ASPA
MIPTEASTANSLLEKPLSQLTEDDIGQITREECRRFLKERGMRRPSWNKSQAIQQVISLKALLEESSDPDDLTAAIKLRRKPSIPPSPRSFASPHSSLPSPSGSGTSRSAATEPKDPSPYRRKDSISPVFTVVDAPRPNPRIVAGVPAGQLTIFYGGKINVYEGVPSDKAREIFQLAAAPDPFAVSTVPSGRWFPQSYSGPVDRGPAAEPGSYSNAPAGNLHRSFKDGLEEGRASREPVPEGPTSRKASLKRYLEKRKDRHKGRRMIDGSSMELIYLSQKLSANPQDEHSRRSNSCSALQLKTPCPRMSSCTSFEPKKLGFYVDLNEDAAGGN